MWHFICPFLFAHPGERYIHGALPAPQDRKSSIPAATLRHKGFRRTGHQVTSCRVYLHDREKTLPKGGSLPVPFGIRLEIMAPVFGREYLHLDNSRGRKLFAAHLEALIKKAGGRDNLPISLGVVGASGAGRTPMVQVVRRIRAVFLCLTRESEAA